MRGRRHSGDRVYRSHAVEATDVLPFRQKVVHRPTPGLKYFKRLATGINVEPLKVQIAAHPEFWNAHPGRTKETSPHYGVDDIWVRYRSLDELTEPKKFIEPHFGTFYPAWYYFTALHPIVFMMMAKVNATHLGGILITKIPPGGQVKPHHDRGSWHAEFMDTKVYVGIQSNPGCYNYCEDEVTVIKTGEAVQFNNLLTHSVENNGLTDRITAIICMATS